MPRRKGKTKPKDTNQKPMMTWPLILIFLIGFGILIYPQVSFWVADRNCVTGTQMYETYVTGLSDEEIAAEWEKAKSYNERMIVSTVQDPFASTEGVDPFGEYEQTLNINGIMGYLTVPSIELRIPIYHGTSDPVLEQGAGHIKATALPIGGEGLHPVLTGHTGLPKARLFTDIRDMKEGDHFSLHILDQVLTYEADQILVVLPDDISDLKPVIGEDYVTLLTCTPYGVNTHRLLVRGHRVPTDPDDLTKPEDPGFVFKWWMAVAALLILILIGAIIYDVHKRRKWKKSIKK